MHRFTCKRLFVILASVSDTDISLRTRTFGRNAEGVDTTRTLRSLSSWFARDLCRVSRVAGLSSFLARGLLFGQIPDVGLIFRKFPSGVYFRAESPVPGVSASLIPVRGLTLRKYGFDVNQHKCAHARVPVLPSHEHSHGHSQQAESTTLKAAAQQHQQAKPCAYGTSICAVLLWQVEFFGACFISVIDDLSFAAAVGGIAILDENIRNAWI